MSLLLLLQSDSSTPDAVFVARQPTTLTLEEDAVKAGDTWPPLRMRAEDADGLLPLDRALSLLVRLRVNGQVTQGAGEAIDPDAEDGFNCRYVFADGAPVAGSYEVELGVTWAAGLEQTVPARRGPVLAVTHRLA